MVILPSWDFRVTADVQQRQNTTYSCRSAPWRDHEMGTRKVKGSNQNQEQKLPSSCSISAAASVDKANITVRGAEPLESSPFMAQQVQKYDFNFEKQCTSNWLFYGDSEHLLNAVRSKQGEGLATPPTLHIKAEWPCTETEMLRFIELSFLFMVDRQS